MLADIPEALQTFFAPQIKQLGLRESRAEFGGYATLPHDLGEGYLWVAALGPNCLLSIHDFTLHEEVALSEYPSDSFAISLMTANMAELAPVEASPLHHKDNTLAFHQNEEDVRFTLPRNARCRSTTLCFLPEYFEHMAQISDADPDLIARRFERAVPNYLPPQINRCLRSLTPKPRSGREEALHYASSAFEALSLLAATPNEALPTKRDSEIVGKAREFMGENLDRRLTVEEIASKIFVSRSTLSRAFRNVEGKGVSRIVSEMKMERATDLLIEGALSTEKIAREVGFAHQSSFCNAYKRHFGKSPADVRRAKLQRYG